MDAVVDDVEAHSHVEKEKVEAKISCDVPNGGEMVSRKNMFAMIDEKRKGRHHIGVRCP